MATNWVAFAALIVILASASPPELGAFHVPYMQLPQATPTSALQTNDATDQPPASTGAPPDGFLRQYASLFPMRDLAGCTVLVTDQFTNADITPNHPKSGSVEVQLIRCIYHQYTLFGRRSFIYTAHIATNNEESDKDAEPKMFTVKFSYEVDGRDTEHSLINIAHANGVPHMPQIFYVARYPQAAALQYPDNAPEQQEIETVTDGRAAYDRVLHAMVLPKYNTVYPLMAQFIYLLPRLVDQVLDCMLY